MHTYIEADNKTHVELGSRPERVFEALCLPAHRSTSCLPALTSRPYTKIKPIRKHALTANTLT